MILKFSEQEKKILLDNYDMIARNAQAQANKVYSQGYENGLKDTEKANRYESQAEEARQRKAQTEKHGFDWWDSSDLSYHQPMLSRRAARAKEGSVLKVLAERIRLEV